MLVEEKVSLIEECMDLDAGTLNINSQIDIFEEWDSLTVLSIIAAVAEKNHQIIPGEEFKKVKTVSDIVKLIK